MRPLVVGNWKMNGARDRAIGLARALADGLPALACDMVICPPFPLLYPLGQELVGTHLALGAQDCHQAVSGAFTGDIAAEMVAETGATHVIVGHSERRQYHGETNIIVRAKAAAAMRAGLIPIVCVGESESERSRGREQAIVGTQLDESLPDDFAGAVAYEPIWAIGTGLTPTLENVTQMHGFMRARLLARFGGRAAQWHLLYGGSVKSTNAARLLAVEHVNGALVGGASLDANEFLAIARAAVA